MNGVMVSAFRGIIVEIALKGKGGRRRGGRESRERK